MLCVEPNFALGASPTEDTVEELLDLLPGCKAFQLPIGELELIGKVR